MLTLPFPEIHAEPEHPQKNGEHPIEYLDVAFRLFLRQDNIRMWHAQLASKPTMTLNDRSVQVLEQPFQSNRL